MSGAEDSAPVTTEALIEQWAELQFLPEQIALALDLDETEARERMDTPSDAWGQAYLRGQLRAEAAVRKAVYTAATQGSTPAQKQFEEYVSDRRRREVR